MELFKLLGTIAIKNDEAIEAIDETTGKAESSEGKMSRAFEKIGGVVAGAFAADKIKDFGLACSEAAAEAQATASQFSQVFGEYEGEATKSLSIIAGEAGVAENRMKGSFTKIAAFAKTTGMETSDALSLADRAMVAVADSAAFYDRSLEETTESLQSFLKGNYENDAALGLSCTETTRNAAANELYGKSFQELSEQQKQLTLLKMVEDANELSGALGQAARESDTWTNQTGNLQQAWTDFQAVLGSSLLPTLIPIIKVLAEKLAAMGEKVQEVQKWCAEHETTVRVLATAFGILTAAVVAYKTAMAISAIIQKAQTAMQGMTVAQYALNTAMSLNPIGLVVAAIAALIAIGVALYKNWDVIKEKAVQLWEKISTTFENIKNSIVDAVNGAFEIIKSIWEDVYKPIFDGICEFFLGVFTLDFQRAFDGLKGIVEGCFNYIEILTEKVFGGIKNTITGAIDKIKEFFGFAKDAEEVEVPSGETQSTGSGADRGKAISANGVSAANVAFAPVAASYAAQNSEAIATHGMDSVAAAITSAMSDLALNVTVNVDPDNRGIFKIVQTEADIWKKSTGKGAFA